MESLQTVDFKVVILATMATVVPRKIHIHDHAPKRRVFGRISKQRDAASKPRLTDPVATELVHEYIISLGQWLNFKLFGITYLVGKIKFKLFFFRVHWLSEISFVD